MSTIPVESNHAAVPGNGTDASANVSQPWQVAARLLESWDLQAVLGRVVEEGRNLVEADGAVVLIRDQESGAFLPAVPSVAVGMDERWLRRQGLEAIQALAARAATAGSPLSLPADQPGDLELPLLRGGRRPAGLIVAPLTARGSVVGALHLFWETAGEHQHAAGELCGFAAIAGPAIANAQEHARQLKAQVQLQALDEASKVIAGELSIAQVLQRIVEIAAQMAQARYGALGVLGDDGYLTDFITTGISAEERERIGPLPRGHGLLGVLIRMGEPLRVAHIARDPRRVGFPPNHPPMTSLLGVPIRSHNRVVGDLYLTDKLGGPEFTEDDQRLIELLAAHAGIAIENARLYAEMGELTLLRERERFARDLHDGLIQNIYAATLGIEDVAEDLQGKPHERLLGIADGLTSVIQDVRTYIRGLRARDLEGRLLPDAVGELVREADESADARISMVLEGQIYRLPDTVANAVLLMVREALANVGKHAHAAHVEVRLRYDPEGITLSIADDGVGFDPGAPRDDEHHGLHNLGARAVELGGSFTVRSARGAGTTLTITVPAPQAHHA